MNRLLLNILSLVIFCSMSCAAISNAQSNPAMNHIDITNVLPSFYELWKDSAFGNHPNRTESAAWIIKKNNGSFEFYKWPKSGSWAKEVWVGPVPRNTVGQAHTHPSKRDAMPSHADRSVSKKTNVPIFTISVHGIWKATPDGKIIKIAGYNWYRKISPGKLSRTFGQHEFEKKPDVNAFLRCSTIGEHWISH